MDVAEADFSVDEDDVNTDFTNSNKAIVDSFADFTKKFDQTMDAMREVVTLAAPETDDDNPVVTVDDRTIAAVGEMLHVKLGSRYPDGVTRQIADEIHQFYTCYFTLLPKGYVHPTRVLPLDVEQNGDAQ
jgi:hypothetical protein